MTVIHVASENATGGRLCTVIITKGNLETLQTSPFSLAHIQGFLLDIEQKQMKTSKADTVQRKKMLREVKRLHYIVLGKTFLIKRTNIFIYCLWYAYRNLTNSFFVVMTE